MKKFLFAVFASTLFCLASPGMDFPRNPIVAHRELHFPGEGILRGLIEINNQDYADYAVQIDADNSYIRVAYASGGSFMGETVRAGEAISVSAFRGTWTITGDSGYPVTFTVYDNVPTVLDFIPEGDPRGGVIGMRVQVRGEGAAGRLMNWGPRQNGGWPPHDRRRPPPPVPAPNPNPWDNPPRPVPNPIGSGPGGGVDWRNVDVPGVDPDGGIDWRNVDVPGGPQNEGIFDLPMDGAGPYQ